jgi:CHAT domain
MPADVYDDLQLRIDRDADGSYRVLAMAPDGRTARGSFTSPVTDAELDDFVTRVGLARRRRSSPDDRIEAIKELGSSLFEALIKDDVGSVYHAARSAASERDRGLRLTLRLSGSPELMRLPWEFLYKRPRFITQSTHTPLVRALDVDSALRPHPVQLPLRILGIVSSPSGYPELDADAERRNLEGALEAARRAGLVEVTWLERATLGELDRRISEPDDVHVLHYIGHGAYDEATESGVLVLETPQGRAHDVSGEDIGAMLQDEASLRLVVLNACEGARTSHVDPFSGVATSLVNFDIPAVIGMQFEITDDAAIAFSESLYTGLARGLPVDAALAPARRAIIGAMMATEFGTPVLFLRDGDARLFDIADPAVGVATMEAATGARDASDASTSDRAATEVPTSSETDAGATPADPKAHLDRGVSGASSGGGSGRSVAVVSAWIGGMVLALNGALLLLGTASFFATLYSEWQAFIIGGFVAQAFAVAILTVHYLTRPSRDVVAVALCALALALSVVIVIGVITDPSIAVWSHLGYGLTLVVLGAWLLRARRKGAVSPFAASLGAPALWVLIAGGIVVGVGLVGFGGAAWMQNLLWPVGAFGMGWGYLYSGVMLRRELRASGTGGDRQDGRDR